MLPHELRHQRVNPLHTCLPGMLFAGEEHPRKACVEGVYPLMSKFVGQHPLGDGFLWAADMQEDLAEPLYVDSLHYSGRMSELFARSIVNAMSERDLLPAKGR